MASKGEAKGAAVSRRDGHVTRPLLGAVSPNAEFVVDTTGRVDMSQFKVLKSTHDLFVNAVKNALTSMRFYPAEIGGRKVKQLVQQPFNFSLTK